MRTQSLPYLAEEVSAADRFNIVNFLFLLLFVGLIGLWVYSMFPLLGKFGKTIGLGKFINKQEVSETQKIVETPDVKWSFIIQPTRADNPDQGSSATSTPESTPTVQPNKGPEYQFNSGPDLSYNPAAQYYQRAIPTFLPDEISQIRSLTQGEPLEPVKAADLRNIVYDLDWSLYTRSDDLEIKYGDQEVIRTVQGKFSYYWPPLGGTNCDIQFGKEECLYVADGTRVVDRIGIGWACDVSIPLGSIIEIVELDLFGICVDRGYTIRQDAKDGLFWFDHLMEWPLLDWEAPITVLVRTP